MKKSELVSGGLREARKLMNSKGLHWTKRFLRLGLYAAPKYCAIGGINATFGLPVAHAQKQTLSSDRQAVDKAQLDARDRAILALATEIIGEPVHLLSDAEREIMRWNDNDSRTWEEVSRVLQRVARKVDSGKIVVRKKDGGYQVIVT